MFFDCVEGATRWWSGEITDQAEQHAGIIAQQAQATVAWRAKQAAHLPRVVVVIDHKRLVFCGASCAASPLDGQEPFVFGLVDAVAGQQVAFASAVRTVGTVRGAGVTVGIRAHALAGHTPKGEVSRG